jgi:hypothetical protein
VADGNRQVLAYAFPAGSEFQGGLVGALERIESGGAMRIVGGIFVARQPEGELVAVAMRTESSAGLTGRLLAFRLDDHARRKATEQVLDSEVGDAVRTLADTLGRGEAVAAVAVEHTWALTLADTVDRMGGTELLSEHVDKDHGELSDLLVAAVQQRQSD